MWLAQQRKQIVHHALALLYGARVGRRRKAQDAAIGNLAERSRKRRIMSGHRDLRRNMHNDLRRYSTGCDKGGMHGSCGMRWRVRADRKEPLKQANYHSQHGKNNDGKYSDQRALRML